MKELVRLDRQSPAGPTPGNDGRAGGAAPHGTSSGRGRILYISGTPLVLSKLGPARRNSHLVSQLSRFFATHVLAPGTPADVDTIVSSFRGQLSNAVVVPPQHRSRSKFAYKMW